MAKALAPVVPSHLEEAFKASSYRDPSAYERDILLTISRKRGDDAVWAVQMIFSDDFAWVKNNKLEFLANDSTWNKHLVPMLSAREAGTLVFGLPKRQAGEQAEFGERPEGSGFRKEW
jgi:hypothetical protein